MEKNLEFDQFFEAEDKFVQISFREERLVVHVICKKCQCLSTSEYNKVKWYQIDFKKGLIFLPFMDPCSELLTPYTFDDVVSGACTCSHICECGQKEISNWCEENGFCESSKDLLFNNHREAIII